MCSELGTLHFVKYTNFRETSQPLISGIFNLDFRKILLKVHVHILEIKADKYYEKHDS